MDEFDVFIVLVLLTVTRIVYVLLKTPKSYRTVKRRSSKDKVRTVIVIGSGGHTSEMMYLVRSLNLNRYSPRLYLMASSDTWSEQRVHEFEYNSKFKDSQSNNYEVVKIPRSRKVHQSYFTSIFTTMYSTVVLVPNLLFFKPDLVLCNGPGTCVPVCVIAFLMRCSFISDNTIIFLESICRVKSLSLTGKILQWFADEIMVQWPELLIKCKRAKYIGRVA